MLGDLIRKILGNDQPPARKLAKRIAPGAASGSLMGRSGVQDASQLPSGMNFDRQSLNIPEGFGGTNPPLPQGMRFQSGLRDQRAKDVAPFRMFEDNTFQGRPSDNFRMTNPDYTFYEDNSFSAPQRLNVTTGGKQPFGRSYEDEYTPNEALHQTGYYNPQTTRNGGFYQGSLSDYYRLKY